MLFCLMAPIWALDPLTCTTCDGLVGTWSGALYTRARSASSQAFPTSADDLECLPGYLMVRVPLSMTFKWVDGLLVLSTTVSPSWTYNLDTLELTPTFGYSSKAEGNNAVVTSVSQEGGLNIILDDGTPICIPAVFDFVNGVATLQFLTAVSLPTDCAAGPDYGVSCGPDGAVLLSRLIKK